MSLLRSRGLRPQSDRQKAREIALRKNRPELLRRSKSRCELTGIADEPLELHHPFSRHHLSPRWTNDPDCLVVVARSAHRALTNADTPEAHDLASRAREQVLERLRARLGRLGCTLEVWSVDPRREALLLCEAIEEREGE